MNSIFTMIAACLGVLVSLVTLASYYNGKIKDAEKMGALKQRVCELEKQQEENKATKSDINSLLIAVGKMTGQIESLQKAVDELKNDMKCIERRKE